MIEAKLREDYQSFLTEAARLAPDADERDTRRFVCACALRVWSANGLYAPAYAEAVSLLLGKPFTPAQILTAMACCGDAARPLATPDFLARAAASDAEAGTGGSRALAVALGRLLERLALVNGDFTPAEAAAVARVAHALTAYCDAQGVIQSTPPYSAAERITPLNADCYWLRGERAASLPKGTRAWGSLGAGGGVRGGAGGVRGGAGVLDDDTDDLDDDDDFDADDDADDLDDDDNFDADDDTDDLDADDADDDFDADDDADDLDDDDDFDADDDTDADDDDTDAAADAPDADDPADPANTIPLNIDVSDLIDSIANSIAAGFSDAFASNADAIPPDAIVASPDAPASRQPVPASRQSAPAERQTLSEALAELDGLVGLSGVKKDVHSLFNHIKICRLRESRGLSVPTLSYHLVFTGNPGTGKTTVARLIALLYYRMGLLAKGQLVETDRSALIAGYLGQTALKTQRVIGQAIGGVLFIDEAYALANDPQDSYGKEAVETLLKAMEDHRDEMVVIVAGYDALMHEFIDSNPGLRSRFNKFFHFPDYTGGELFQIFQRFCEKNGYAVAAGQDDALRARFDALYAGRAEHFGNARAVRNLFERAINAQSDRLAQCREISDDDLRALTAADLDAAFEGVGV